MIDIQSCVSDLTMDRYLVDELSTDAAASLEKHAAACPRCAERLATLRTDTTSARDALPPRTIPATRHIGWVGALAIAAGLVLAVLVGRELLDQQERTAPAPERIAQTRTKGPAHLTLYVRRSGRVQAFTGEALRAGDELAFAYTSGFETHLALFDVDAGQATCLFPPGGSTAAVEAGADVELDIAVALDGSPTEESIVAVFCEDSNATAPLQDALSSGSALPTTCRAEWIRLPKERRP